MKISDNRFDGIEFWTNRLLDIDQYILSSSKCVDLFDQNGYHLTAVEQAYAQTNGYPVHLRRHETVIRRDWMIWENRIAGAHINHSDLFERKAYNGQALEQLSNAAQSNPLLYKVIKMKSKWGIDISIDFVSKDAVFEVFHYEWDSFEYPAIEEKKQEIEQFVITQDWDHVASLLWKRKEEWIELDFFGQSKWRTDYFNLSPEKFKNIIWIN